MIQHSGTPFPAERGGDGSMGTPGTLGAQSSGASGPDLGASGAGGMATGGSNWTRSDETNRSEFGAFLDDLSELARRGGQGTELRGELERRVSQARARMSAALDQGMEMSARARDRMNRGIEVSRDAVAERPLSALAIAAVGGLLVGLLLSRRD